MDLYKQVQLVTLFFNMKIYLRICFSFLLIILFSACAHFPSKETSTQSTSPKNKYDVIIYRDTWGVPHIFGKTDADAAYGLAYANAEDDLRIFRTPCWLPEVNWLPCMVKIKPPMTTWCIFLKSGAR